LTYQEGIIAMARMPLHWSSRSPYVRKVVVAAHELGLADRIETVPTKVAMTAIDPAMLPRNPLGKIPALQTPEHGWLYDSFVICEYLDGLAAPSRLFPGPGPARVESGRRHALGNGFLDILLLWRTELTRTPQHPGIIAGFEAKRTAILAVLEQEAPALAAGPFEIGRLTIAVALAYLDFRWPDFDWRIAHPRLSAWEATIAARPAMQASPFIDA
jgi:glutathione S-transferase